MIHNKHLSCRDSVTQLTTKLMAFCSTLLTWLTRPGTLRCFATILSCVLRWEPQARRLSRVARLRYFIPFYSVTFAFICTNSNLVLLTWFWCLLKPVLSLFSQLGRSRGHAGMVRAGSRTLEPSRVSRHLFPRASHGSVRALRYLCHSGLSLSGRDIINFLFCFGIGSCAYFFIILFHVS